MFQHFVLTESKCDIHSPSSQLLERKWNVPYTVYTNLNHKLTRVAFKVYFYDAENSLKSSQHYHIVRVAIGQLKIRFILHVNVQIFYIVIVPVTLVCAAE